MLPPPIRTTRAAKDGNLPDRLPAMMSKGDDNEILLKYQVTVDWDEDLETFFLSNEVRNASWGGALIDLHGNQAEPPCCCCCCY